MVAYESNSSAPMCQYTRVPPSISSEKGYRPNAERSEPLVASEPARWKSSEALFLKVSVAVVLELSAPVAPSTPSSVMVVYTYVYA